MTGLVRVVVTPMHFLTVWANVDTELPGARVSWSLRCASDGTLIVADVCRLSHVPSVVAWVGQGAQ